MSGLKRVEVREGEKKKWGRRRKRLMVINKPLTLKSSLNSRPSDLILELHVHLHSFLLCVYMIYKRMSCNF